MRLKIIDPSVKLATDFVGKDVMQFLERCGRVCYKSENKITNGSSEKFIRNIIKRGHESVLEHFSATFIIICDRGISHEIVRHRIASYSQESTRYCDYAKGELTFVKPCFWNEQSLSYCAWKNTMQQIEDKYLILRDNKSKPEEARSILPNSLKTELVMTANLREWRHFFKLRTSENAHPQMRQIARMMLHVLEEKLPVVFEDIKE